MNIKEIKKKYEKIINRFLLDLEEIENQYNIYANIELLNGKIYVRSHFATYRRSFKIDNISLNDNTEL